MSMRCLPLALAANYPIIDLACFVKGQGKVRISWLDEGM